MRMNILVGMLLAAIALGSAGCSTVNQAVGESMALGAPEQDIEAELALYRNYFAPEQVMKCLALPRATPERRSCRDLITYARMRYTDLQYGLFRQRVFAAVNGANAATDITVLGLNAAGTLVGGATTKSILAAISGGLVGTKGILNKDMLYNAGIQTLILKMDADRAAVRLRITNNLKQNEEVYPFEAAELDTGDYYRVGTIPNALITLQGNAAATLSYDIHVINNSVPQAPAPSPPGVSVATPPPFPTAAPPPPLPVAPPPPPPPPVPTPPPVAQPPRSPVPAAPPPSSGTIRVKPEASAEAARMELRKALGQGADGKGQRDPARVALMKECWNEQHIAAPAQISLWMAGASAKVLTDVTDCINRKAAAP